MSNLPSSIDQAKEFRNLERELGLNEDVARWDERLKKVATYKPAPEEPQ